MNGPLSGPTRYIGADETAGDPVSAAAVARLAATIGIDPPAVAPGDPLPPGWHPPFFGPVHGPDNMPDDGQAAGGGIVPPVLLFRYSAVRFNSHRIHFDRGYAVDHEGLPGLIVHGTLIWQPMLGMCRAEAPDRPVAGFG